jgi:hypothetical protein
VLEITNQTIFKLHLLLFRKIEVIVNVCDGLAIECQLNFQSVGFVMEMPRLGGICFSLLCGSVRRPPVYEILAQLDELTHSLSSLQTRLVILSQCAW